MGMEITESNGNLCVELDTGSLFSNYEPYISSIVSYPKPDFELASVFSAVSTAT